jgi:flavodoxin
MIYKVVYFTRTGTSQRIAEKIAEKLSCESIQITDNQNWNGFIGFIKGGFYATINKSVKISYSKELDSYDELVVISPLWAGGPVPAIREFLKLVPLDKVHLIMTSDGSSVKNKPECKSVTDIIKNQNNESEVINELVSTLLSAK